MGNKNLISRLLNVLGLRDEVTIKVYHGYGHAGQSIVYGHVLKFGPKPVRHYSNNPLRNTLALLRLFMVKPYPNASVQLKWEDQALTADADAEGFFKFEWHYTTPPQPGWHPVTVTLNNTDEPVSGEGLLFIPYKTQYGFISDIDDTFLISHSRNLRKRLLLLFTRNARSRKPFEGTVKHYRLLAQSNTTAEAPNPFFYVSSSEWNLYDYLLEFTRVQGMPDGVFLLNSLKRWYQLFKTGQNNHATKFMRIARILESYPGQQFILLGDSSQQDPYIYASLVEHFPQQIYAVYIRDIHAKNRLKVIPVLKKIESTGVYACLFKHNADAIEHSKKIGLITAPPAL